MKALTGAVDSDFSREINQEFDTPGLRRPVMNPQSLTCFKRPLVFVSQDQFFFFFQKQNLSRLLASINHEDSGQLGHLLLKICHVLVSGEKIY